MHCITVNDILKICDGTLICGEANLAISSFSKDTRNIKKNDLYLGIKGNNFDGNQFYLEAFAKGAIATILDDEKAITKKEKTIILVNDTVDALQKIAQYKLKIQNIPVVAITGSVGKTSTKDIVASVLSKKYKTLKTIGNLNNGIGLPMTILSLKEEEVAVLEMGMNSLGEISLLSKIAEPDIAIITNVGTAHIGELGSRENILKAKLEIIDGLKENGTLIINNDNDLLNNVKLDKKINLITFGIRNNSDYMPQNIKLINNHTQYELRKELIEVPILGEAFIYNSMVAFIVGKLLNVENERIIEGIKSFELSKSRLEVIKTKKNITIINDCYNANLDSMKSALDFLKSIKAKRKIAVLGDILELGSFGKNIHREVGEIVGKAKIDKLICIGDLSKYIAFAAVDHGIKEDDIYYFTNNQDGISCLKNILKKDDAILIKASNGMKFIEIVEDLQKQYG